MYFFNILTTDSAARASNPVVGPSRNIILGEMINSIPMLVSFLSPLDMFLKYCFPT